MGNIFILLVFEFATILFIMASQKATQKQIQGAHNQAKNLLIWNGIYKSFNEPYVVFVVSCMTQTLALSWDSTGETVNNVLMFITFIAVLAFPFWTFFLLRRNKHRLRQRDFFAKYSSIYDHLIIKDADNWTLLEPCISGFRMLLTIAALMYLQNWKTFQIMIAMFFHICVLVYNGQVMPFKDKTYYFWQQFNEVFVFWTILVMMTFADMTQDTYAENIMGWVLIMIISLNLVLNFGYIIGHAMVLNCRKYRIKYLIWKRKRLRESIEARHARMLAEEARLAG